MLGKARGGGDGGGKKKRPRDHTPEEDEEDRFESSSQRPATDAYAWQPSTFGRIIEPQRGLYEQQRPVADGQGFTMGGHRVEVVEEVWQG